VDAHSVHALPRRATATSLQGPEGLQRLSEQEAGVRELCYFLGRAAFAGPAVADVDFDDYRHERLEERLDERADLVMDYYDEVEDAYEDGFFYFYNPFVVYDIEDV
jgi:hypothetical protein